MALFKASYLLISYIWIFSYDGNLAISCKTFIEQLQFNIGEILTIKLFISNYFRERCINSVQVLNLGHKMRSLTICARFFNETHDFHVLLIEWNISHLQYTDIWRVVGRFYKFLDSTFTMFHGWWTKMASVILHTKVELLTTFCNPSFLSIWNRYILGSNFCSGVKIHFSCICFFADFVSLMWATGAKVRIRIL